MLYQTPRDRRRQLARLLGLAAVFLAGLLVISALDHGLWSFFSTDGSVAKRDWYWLLRLCGYLPTWLAVGAVLVAIGAGSRRPMLGKALALAGSAALGGVIAEITKLIIARDRPGDTGLHHYRGLFAGFADGSNLGMPSSHAAVAFGAAFAASRMFPASCWVLVPLAVGCGITRLLMGDHFASDVYVAAWVGCLAARVCVPESLIPRRRPGTTRLTA